MKETIRVRLDKDIARMLAQVVKLSRRSQSDVIREALRRQLAIDLFDELGRQVAPFAEAQGLLTDEDVFNQRFLALAGSAKDFPYPPEPPKVEP